MSSARGNLKEARSKSRNRPEGQKLRETVLSGGYHPQAVRGVRIPKPGGGERQLGIPTVEDRLIQQAIDQQMSKHYEGFFSDSSYGFGPGRSAHQAVMQASAHVAAGYQWVVDIDLKSFFDQINDDRLMQRLIQRYLRSGLMEDGLESQRTSGTPHGGPLSPLLSNIYLDELDKELEKRGHRFCRYADDCNIYLKSRKAGELASVWLPWRDLEGWIRRRLRCYRLKQCGRKYTVFKFLRSLGAEERPAWNAIMYGGRWWSLSQKVVCAHAMNNQWFAQQGLESLAAIHQRVRR